MWLVWKLLVVVNSIILPTRNVENLDFLNVPYTEYRSYGGRLHR